MFDRFTESVSAGYDKTKEGVKQLASKAKDGVGNLVDKTASNSIVKKYGIDVYNDLKEKVKDLKEELKDELLNNPTFLKYKAKLSRYVVLKLERLIESQLNKLAGILKKETDDPDMPGCIRSLKNDLIDEFFPDIKEEVMYSLRMGVNKPYLEIADPEEGCCLFKPLYWFRAWVLHTLDPVDLTIWQRIKTVSFWFWQMVQMFPLYGVQTFFLLFYFLIMCKSDEYQLVNYIVSFKKLQFVTIGCVGGLIAYIQYFLCVAMANPAVGEYGCLKANPGDGMIWYWVEIGTFGLKVILVWLCYLLLPCSEKRGQASFRHLSESEEAKQSQESKLCCNLKRGGTRLRWLMLWELISMALTIGLFFILYYLVVRHDKAGIQQTIYFCQTIYGLLSFPFLLFSVPMMTTLLTKTRPTKYDRHGRCVADLPSLLKLQEKEKQESQAREERKRLRAERKERKTPLPDDEDIEGLLQGDGGDNIFDDMNN